MRYELIIGIIIPCLWLAWIAYWWYSARDVKRTTQPEPLASRLQHRVPMILGVLCFAAPRLMPRALAARFLPPGPLFPILGTALLALGLGLAVWARRHLGRNWSMHVVVKEGHTLIRTGPYRHVRHPIYSGILLGMLGMAIAIGEWRVLVGFGWMLLSFAIKSRQEERRMRETFTEYADYLRHTAAMIPYVY
jgi:protein-S-isoprenylcysteine O-methyltransferase Ste14